MKQILLVTLFGIFGISQLKAQNNFEMGLYFGIPIVSDESAFVNEDWQKDYNFNLGFTAAYYFQVVENLKVGLMTGFDHFILDFSEDETGFTSDDGNFVYLDVDADGESYIPIAASTKYYFSDKFFAGLDLGYAIDISGDNGTGGIYYRPRISFSTRVIDLYAFYKGMNFNDYGHKIQIGSAGLGLSFKF